MGRLGKLKRQAIQEANERNLGIIEENHAGFSLGFANNGGLTIQEEEVNDVVEEQDVSTDKLSGTINYKLKTDDGEQDEDTMYFDSQEEIDQLEKSSAERLEKEKSGEDGSDNEMLQDLRKKHSGGVEEQADFGDGAEGEGESPLEQVTEGSFAKYNITLKD